MKNVLSTFLKWWQCPLPIEDLQLIAWHYQLAHGEPRSYVMFNGEEWPYNPFEKLQEGLRGITNLFEQLGFSFANFADSLSSLSATLGVEPIELASDAD